MQVRKNYELLADLRGRQLNFMEGLELYEGLLSPQEQALMIRNCLKWKQAGHEVCLAAHPAHLVWAQSPCPVPFKASMQQYYGPGLRG